MLTESEKIIDLKKRIAELEQDRKFLFEQLRALERRLAQMDEAKMWQELSDNEDRYGYW